MVHTKGSIIVGCTMQDQYESGHVKFSGCVGTCGDMVCQLIRNVRIPGALLYRKANWMPNFLRKEKYFILSLTA